MSPSLRADMATVRVLVRREFARFFRDRGRMAGALAQALLFWSVLGSGFAPSFREGLDYRAYFFAGSLLLVTLFAAMFGTMTVVEDRHQGFLQGVLAGPGSRISVALGKSLAVALLSLAQSAAFLLLAPVAGHPWAGVHGIALLGVLFMAAFGLAALGVGVAWKLDSSAGYHAVMNLLLLPAWVLSGALYPAGAQSGVLRVLVRVDPLAYTVSAVRWALGEPRLASAGPSFGPLGDVLVTVGAAVAALALTVRWIRDGSR